MKSVIEESKYVSALAPITPASSVPAFVSLENYRKLAVVITVDNGTDVTGSAISLIQAKDAEGADAKALSFDTVFANIDTDSGDTLVKTEVESDTFTTDATADANLLYVIGIDVADLDVNEDFTHVRLVTADGANMALSAVYQLYEGRYHQETPPSAV